MCSGLFFVFFIKELLCRVLHSGSDLLHRKGTQKRTQRSATKAYTETTICKVVHINTVIYKTKRTEVSRKSVRKLLHSACFGKKRNITVTFSNALLRLSCDKKASIF